MDPSLLEYLKAAEDAYDESSLQVTFDDDYDDDNEGQAVGLYEDYESSDEALLADPVVPKIHNKPCAQKLEQQKGQNSQECPEEARKDATESRNHRVAARTNRKRKIKAVKPSPPRKKSEKALKLNEQKACSFEELKTKPPLNCTPFVR